MGPILLTDKGIFNYFCLEIAACDLLNYQNYAYIKSVDLVEYAIIMRKYACLSKNFAFWNT